jgi:hypothetical protein
MRSDIPLPMPALRDLLAQPHDEGGAGGEGEHGHHLEGDAGALHDLELLAQRHLLEVHGDAERLHDGEEDGAVAGVLRDLAASELAFLGELLQVGPDHGEELQDDGRGDVRHDPEGEDGDPREVAAREHVHEPEPVRAVLLEEVDEGLGVDARRGDVVAEAVHGQEAEGEAAPSS